MDRVVLDRRTLLRLLGSLLLVGTGGGACRREDSMARAADRDVTRTIFRDRESAVAVGREYLRARPDEADTKQLSAFERPELTLKLLGNEIGQGQLFFDRSGKGSKSVTNHDVITAFNIVKRTARKVGEQILPALEDFRQRLPLVDTLATTESERTDHSFGGGSNNPIIV